jgi:large subunit ribosomal protein L15
VVNLSDLETEFQAGATVDAAAMKTAGLIPDVTTPVKILGDGALTKKLTIKANWYSKSASRR